MHSDLDLDQVATEASLLESLEALGQYCAEQHIARETIARLKIVVEELFSNTIKYGYGEACRAPIRLHLSVASGILLIYEDDAAAFDLTKWNVGAVLEAGPEDRLVGQNGIALVLGLAKSVVYVPRAGGNRIELTFA